MAATGEASLYSDSECSETNYKWWTDTYTHTGGSQFVIRMSSYGVGSPNLNIECNGWLDTDEEDEDGDESDGPLIIGWPDEYPDASSHAGGWLNGIEIVVDETVTLRQLALISKRAGDDVRMVLYTDDGGTPDILMASTEITTTGVGPLEMDVDSVVLEPGSYWIMTVWAGSGSIGIDSSSSEAMSTMVRDKTWSIYDAPPNPFGSAGGYTGQRFNFYMVTDR
jgi:hypothetical protein